jgi:hypothetical protein
VSQTETDVLDAIRAGDERASCTASTFNRRHAALLRPLVPATGWVDDEPLDDGLERRPQPRTGPLWGTVPGRHPVALLWSADGSIPTGMDQSHGGPHTAASGPRLGMLVMAASVPIAVMALLALPIALSAGLHLAGF